MKVSANLREGFSSLKNALSDLFFPPICPFCDSSDVDSAESLCPDCAESISEVKEPFCRQCGLPLPDDSAVDRLYCGRCLVLPPAYGRARYGVRYKGRLQEGLQRFKYGGALHASNALADLLVGAFHKHYKQDEFDLILPVPIHRKKLRERGFNQVIVLAEKLSSRVGIPINRTCLKKSIDTAPQASLTRRERLANLRGSFRVTRPETVKDLRVLLVDDVATTGSTINEVARTISRAGAASVEALILALTPRTDND